MDKIKVRQFVKTDDFELLVTEAGKVWQRGTSYKSTGGMYKKKVWNRWHKRDIEKELKNIED